MRKKTKWMLLMMTTALLMVFPPFISWAEDVQTKDYQEYTLGEIVNIGKGSAVRDIGIIDEVTPEEFEALNAESVADALTYVPGVQITYGRKSFPSMSIHGFDQNRVLTLIDGVPYYETKYGGLDLSQVGLEGVARIDVVKGAPSVLYGPNALGGVVNIITKQPTEKPFFSVNAEYGVDGLDDAYKAALSHGRKIGKFNYWLSYSHREWDSWDVSEDFDPYPGGDIIGRAGGQGIDDIFLEDGGKRLNSDYKTDNFWAKLGFEPSDDTEIYVNLHYINTEKGSPPDIYENRLMPGRNFSQLARIPSYDDWGVDVSAQHSFTDRFNLQAKIYYHDHEDDYDSYNYDYTYALNTGLLRLTDGFALSTYKDYNFGGILLGDYALSDWDTLRFSFHYKKDSHEQRALESNPFAESLARTGSIGLENELSWFNDKLSVVAGVSYDWYDVTDAEDDPNDDGNIIELDTPDTTDEFNPMLGITYQANRNVSLFASVARKTRFPTLDQLYSGDQPNLDLESETAVNYTAGFRWTYGDLLRMEVAPFFHDISDYITRDLPPALNPFGQYKNFDDVEMKGIEINADIMPCKDLLLKIGYMYNDASDESSNRVTDKVRNVPEYTFNISVQYIVPFIGTNLTPPCYIWANLIISCRHLMIRRLTLLKTTATGFAMQK